MLFDATRTVILNGIEEVISRPDLADRSIFLTLVPLPEALRRPSGILWQQFELACPGILGALLDLIARGLPGIAIDRMPRMADFALWQRPAKSPCLRQTAGLRSSAWLMPIRSSRKPAARAQTFLRELGTEITFGREGRAGSWHG